MCNYHNMLLPLSRHKTKTKTSKFIELLSLVEQVLMGGEEIKGKVYVNCTFKYEK